MKNRKFLERRILRNNKYIKCETCKDFWFYEATGLPVCAIHNGYIKCTEENFSSWKSNIELECKLCSYINDNIKKCIYCGVMFEVD